LVDDFAGAELGLSRRATAWLEFEPSQMALIA
jgi:hypothetical protein